MKKIIKISLLITLILCLFTGCGNKEYSNSNKEKDVYSFKYNDLKITPGEVFDKEKYTGYSDYVELPSCAFEDTDRAYTYNHYEITTYTLNKEERILSVYFLDTEISTTEGVSISDSVNKMLDVYGNNYEKNDNLYTYKKEDTLINFIVENDIIVSIEYSYDIES